MATNSKQKGKAGELELSRTLNQYGYKTRRSVQYNGKTEEGQPDLVGLPGIHVECKRTEKLKLYDAVDQAKRDSIATEGNGLPAVFHRKNNCEWVVIMPLKDWMQIYSEYQSGMVKQAQERHLSPLIEAQTENRCVCCGEIIPEGRMTCNNCEYEVKEHGDYKEYI